MRVGPLIRKYRKAARLAQSDVTTRLRALDSKIDQGAVSDVELGKRIITIAESALFIQVLEIPKQEMDEALSAELDAAMTKHRQLLA